MKEKEIEWERERKNTVFILWNHIIIRTSDYSELNWWINVFSQQLREACIWCGLKAQITAPLLVWICAVISKLGLVYITFKPHCSQITYNVIYVLRRTFQVRSSKGEKGKKLILPSRILTHLCFLLRTIFAQNPLVICNIYKNSRTESYYFVFHIIDSLNLDGKHLKIVSISSLIWFSPDFLDWLSILWLMCQHNEIFQNNLSFVKQLDLQKKNPCFFLLLGHFKFSLLKTFHFLLMVTNLLF